MVWMQFSHQRLSVRSPAALKTLSHGMEVAGVLNSFW